MLNRILLIIVGAWLNAPAWYFVLCGVALLADILTFGMKMYQRGMDV